MELHVRLEGHDKLAAQIYQQVRTAILTGRLAHGERMPPTRELARRLDVSRNTVSLAYEWLVAEGLLSGRSGAGTFVEGSQMQQPDRSNAPAEIRHRRVWDAVLAPAPRAKEPHYDFSAGVPDATLFPFDTWRRLLAREVRPARLQGSHGDPAGHPALRAAVARHASVSRGVKASAEDVIVTNGAQHAFDLIARVLLEAGSRVAVEDPGYAPARLLFQSLGAEVTAVPVDDAGLDVASLPDGARLVYVTPSHQFPLGMPMSHARREALLAWAARRNAMIIEDDYDSEFRFGGRPLETLQSLELGRRNGAGRVIYVGSFSKSLVPALRLGFLIAPPPLQAPLRAACHLGGWCGQWPVQGALATMIDRGLLGRHVRKMRRIYAERHDRILHALTADFSGWLVPQRSVTGLHITATFLSGSLAFERDLTERALASGLHVERLSTYYATRRRKAGLVLGYGAIPTAQIASGLALLRDCFVRIQ